MSPSTKGNIAALLTALFLGAGSTALAQGALPGGRGAVAQDTIPTADLRCLTARDDQCLPEPVSMDEPHGAVCATCHNLWAQGTPARAIESCTAAGCHDQPDALTPFHATVAPAVLEDCLACHDPHDAVIPGGARDCAYCHAGPGEAARMGGATGPNSPLTVAPNLVFGHGDHGEEACTTCHASGIGHGVVRVTGLEDCRSCHHREPVVSDCLGCHVHDAPRAEPREVDWRFQIEVGSLVHPVRRVVFDHERHGDTDCRICHSDGLAMTAKEPDCTGCHEEHHRPSADCTSCHEAPAPTAHTTKAHFGCGGAGCHEQAPAGIVDAPRTRELCLSCHTELKQHEPDKSCAACHKLPPPRKTTSR